MKNGRLSVEEAAKLMNANPQFIRIGLQRGAFPWGYAVKTSSQYTYFIMQEKFEEYLGIQKEQNKEIDPESGTEIKIKLLQDEIEKLKNDLNDLNLVINGLLDNQEYLIKSMNGGKVKGYSTTFSSAIMNFRKKPVYDFPEEKVTVKRTAELLGVSPIVIHLGIINGDFPFGTVTQKVLYDGNHRNEYHIFAKKLAEYLKISVEEVKGKANQ